MSIQLQFVEFINSIIEMHTKISNAQPDVFSHIQIKKYIAVLRQLEQDMQGLHTELEQMCTYLHNVGIQPLILKIERLLSYLGIPDQPQQGGIPPGVAYLSPPSGIHLHRQRILDYSKLRLQLKNFFKTYKNVEKMYNKYKQAYGEKPLPAGEFYDAPNLQKLRQQSLALQNDSNNICNHFRSKLEVFDHDIATEIKKLENKMNGGRRRTHDKRRRTRRPRHKRTKRRRRRKRTKRRRKRKYQFGGLRFPITTAQFEGFKSKRWHAHDCFPCALHFFGAGSPMTKYVADVVANAGRHWTHDAPLQFFQKNLPSVMIDQRPVQIRYQWSKLMNISAAFERVTPGFGMVALIWTQGARNSHCVVFARTKKNGHPILIDPQANAWWMGWPSIEQYLLQQQMAAMAMVMVGFNQETGLPVNLPTSILPTSVRDSPPLRTPGAPARKTLGGADRCRPCTRAPPLSLPLESAAIPMEIDPQSLPAGSNPPPAPSNITVPTNEQHDAML